MVTAAVLFFGSFIGISTLFGIKYWEYSHERVVAEPVRTKADERALELKAMLTQARIEFAKVPPFLVLLSRYAVREGALGIALLARRLERQAHRLADFVSHKRGFERREPRNEYLKRMEEYKNNGLDTSGHNGHNS